MEKDIFKEIPDFDRLIAGKTFEELSDREKEVIEKFMSPGEYGHLHGMIVSARKEEALARHKLIPDPAIKERLMAGFTTVLSPGIKRTGSRLGSFITIRIPVYQAAAAALLLVMVVFALLFPGKWNNRIIAAADTVYVEKIVRETDTVWLANEKAGNKNVVSTVSGKTMENKSGRPAPGSPDLKVSFNESGTYARRRLRETLAKLAPLTNEKTGHSISEDQGLMKLVSPLY